MPNQIQEPIFSNDEGTITVLDEREGEMDTTHRPASEANRKAIQKELDRQAEIRKLMEELKKEEEGKKPPAA